MNTVITISREFGSGGRELGRRLAEKLDVAYYDQEIISEISKHTELSEQYVSQITEKRPYIPFPITVGRSLSAWYNNIDLQTSVQIFSIQKQIIEEMAQKSDCVIVGRCADYILRDYRPIRIFVYGSLKSKIMRCKNNAPEQEHLSDKDLVREINRIDKNRAEYYHFYTDQEWGDKVNYDICVNTTYMSIKDISESFIKLKTK